MSERNRAATFMGNPLTLVGDEVKVGDKAPDFTLLKNDLSPASMADFAGKVLILTLVPSLDAYSRAFWTPIPRESGQLFHLIPDTDSI